MKRGRDEDDAGEHSAKIHRISKIDNLSKLSDELLVRVLSFVPVPALLICQRVNKKFSRLALDSQLWKAAYYRTFVLPRASLIPGIRNAGNNDRLHYSSKLSKWLDDGDLVKDGAKTHWKQQYRLRHNWLQGQCAVSEIIVAERRPEPPLLVMMSNGIIFTADPISGLRAWTSKSDRELLASTSLAMVGTNDLRLPVSMAINSSNKSNCEEVVLGFADGSFSVYALRPNSRTFSNLYTHPPSANGILTALAYSSPYLLTMTEDHLLSLYVFKQSSDGCSSMAAPTLLYSLRSHTAWPPVSLSLRISTTSIIVAIAYSMPTYLSGWTVGVQELRLTLEGKLLETILATATDDNSFTLSNYRSASSPSTRSSSPFPGTSRETVPLQSPSTCRPTAMSYSHPYLLVAHPDNTLSFYLVKSTSSSLSISSGDRLWGHTSSISGAHVGMRGKAVSVSRLGDELRVWDLEGGVASLSSRKRFKHDDMSVRLQPSKPVHDANSFSKSGPGEGSSLKFALEQSFDEPTISRGWVGFDEHNVVVLREKIEGSQALVVYDFT